MVLSITAALFVAGTMTSCREKSSEVKPDGVKKPVKESPALPAKPSQGARKVALSNAVPTVAMNPAETQKATARLNDIMKQRMDIMKRMMEIRESAVTNNPELTAVSSAVAASQQAFIKAIAAIPELTEQRNALSAVREETRALYLERTELMAKARQPGGGISADSNMVARAEAIVKRLKDLQVELRVKASEYGAAVEKVRAENPEIRTLVADMRAKEAAQAEQLNRLPAYQDLVKTQTALEKEAIDLRTRLKSSGAKLER